MSKFTSPLDGARFALSKGFKVFPILPNQKEPAVSAWQEWAENATTKKIEQYGTANPLHNWGIYCGGSGLLILDVDTKKDKKGIEALQELELNNEPLPRTLTVRTPTGGIHYYFYGEGKNTAGTLGSGLDTRGRGGYVLAPGSRIDQSSYEIEANTEISIAPSWLIAETNKHREPETLKEGVPVEEGKRNEILTSLAGTMRRRGMGFDAILAALEVVNIEQVSPPLQDHEVAHIAESICRYAPQQAEVASDFLDHEDFNLMQWNAIDPNSIPARNWIMHHRYMGGYVSVIVSPGGVGKSMLTMMDAVSVATGRTLTGFDVPNPGGVWLYNTEDPMDELKRRACAIAMHHNVKLKAEDIPFFISSGQDRPFILAKKDQSGVIINQGLIDKTVETIKQKGIKLLIADPFVRTHECEENDNMQMDKVVWCFQRIAMRTGCAVGLVHHASKAGSKAEPGDANIARGATALINAARIAHTISTMSAKEAKRFGIAPERRGWYLRMDNAKANMQPPAERADWFERLNIVLPNSDGVGTLQRVSMTDIRKEKEKEAEKAERSDLAVCFYEVMQPGDRYPLNDALSLILGNVKFKHLFEGYNTTYARQKLIDFFTKEGYVEIYGRRFECDYDPKRRPKYQVICSELTPEETLEGALK